LNMSIIFGPWNELLNFWCRWTSHSKFFRIPFWMHILSC
jgi:hypothetical protein